LRGGRNHMKLAAMASHDSADYTRPLGLLEKSPAAIFRTWLVAASKKARLLPASLCQAAGS